MQKAWQGALAITRSRRLGWSASSAVGAAWGVVRRPAQGAGRFPRILFAAAILAPVKHVMVEEKSAALVIRDGRKVYRITIWQRALDVLSGRLSVAAYKITDQSRDGLVAGAVTGSEACRRHSYAGTICKS